MENTAGLDVQVEVVELYSQHLQRYTRTDLYIPMRQGAVYAERIMLINDGQDLPKIHFRDVLQTALHRPLMQAPFCIAMHCSEARRMEYGVASQSDYAGRGALAGASQQFIFTELLPYLQQHYHMPPLHQMVFAGFSLGGLLALDTVWHHPQFFSTAAVFSGSLWWRSKALDKAYNDATDRIMHQLIRHGKYNPGQRFYFTTGSLDETADRNGNGVIDSIDDTLDLITELKIKGYTDNDICYINFEDGHHDVPTWGRAWPHFLAWAFEKVE